MAPWTTAATTAAKSFQSCPTLCDPIDGSLPYSPVPGILQARTLEWVAISFSNAWKWKVKVKSLSWVRFFTTPWTAAYQAPPAMGFSRQEYWSGVPLLSLRGYTYKMLFKESVYVVVGLARQVWNLYSRLSGRAGWSFQPRTETAVYKWNFFLFREASILLLRPSQFIESGPHRLTDYLG